MDEICITGIGPIVTEPASDTQPGSISIEILTSDGQESLVMSGVVAMELAAARWRVRRCFARFESRFKCTASSCNNGRTNSSGGRITTFHGRDASPFAANAELPVQRFVKTH